MVILIIHFRTLQNQVNISGQATVIDGDTMQVGTDRIRLWGIDAPETGQTCEVPSHQPQPCGQQATLALRSVVQNKRITCQQRDTDIYGRKVAVCWSGQQELNRWLVEQGHAMAYRRYAGPAYDQSEAQARATQRGIWATKFEMPWIYRQHLKDRP